MWRGCLQASLPRVLPVPRSSEIRAFLPLPRFEGTPPACSLRCLALPPRPSALPPRPPGFVSDNPLCVPLSSGPVLGVESTVPSVSVAQQPPSSRGPRGSPWHLTCGRSPEHLWGLEAERVSVLWVASAGGGLVFRSWPYRAHSPWSQWGTWAGGGHPQHGTRAVVPSLWAGLRSYPLRPVPRG